MSEYDTEEYISKVMKLERCTREQALNLIEEFKEIDRDGYSLKKQASYAKAKYHERVKAKRCIQCGTQDELTLSGKTRCLRCRDRQKERDREYKRKIRSMET